jgi:membrane-associated protease RseP (regulator of RpoE activity)
MNYRKMTSQSTTTNHHEYFKDQGINAVNVYNSIVGRVFRIEDTTYGTTKQGYIIRYRGELLIDSEEAYDRLSKAFRVHDITPLFRIIEGKQTIFLKKGVIKPKPSKTWVNIVLFSLTVLSMLYVGTTYSFMGVYDGPPEIDIQSVLPYLQESISGGLKFTFSLLAILLAHEFGHYFVSRYHKTAVSLPYFIPFPNILGTMGAVILTKEIPKNKKSILDIGIAGPLAGLIVTIPVVIWGLSTSNLNRLSTNLVNTAFEGNSILYLALKYLVHGQMLPQPATYGNLHPVLYWIRYFFTGTPLPHGGFDVTMNSVALAGWAGILVTGMNLIPIGQLDGGHLLYGVLGQKTQKVIPFMLGALFLLGLAWNGWWLFFLILFFFNRRHSELLDEITPLDQKRKILALFGLFVFLLVFIPVPWMQIF